MPPPSLQPNNIFHLPPPLRLSLRRFLTSKTPQPQPPKHPNFTKAQSSPTNPTQTQIPSSHSSSTSTSSSTQSPNRLQTRLQILLSHLPPRLQTYTNPLLNAPKTSIVTFLALHEITAIVPLVGIAGFLHWTGFTWIPGDWVVENEYVREGTARFGRWFKRKGWFGFGDRDGDGEAEQVVVVEGGEASERRLEGEGDVRVGEDKDTGVNVGVGSNGSRILMEVAVAYAITKVLLPVRIIGSVWATPYVVRWIGRIKGLVRRR